MKENRVVSNAWYAFRRLQRFSTQKLIDHRKICQRVDELMQQLTVMPPSQEMAEFHCTELIFEQSGK